MSIMALSSFIKYSHQKWKKNHQKDASHLKIIKGLHMASYTRKALKRGEMKNENFEKNLSK